MGSWSGSVYFSDLTPRGSILSLLTIDLYGSFAPSVTPLEITVMINNLKWSTWDYASNYKFDCTTFTDYVRLTGPPVANITSTGMNLLSFVVPEGAPQIFACGAVIFGSYTSILPTSTPS